MKRLRTVGEAAILAAFLAVGMGSTTTVSAFDGVSPNPRICQLLAAAVAKASSLPDGSLKQALLDYLGQQQASINCR